MPVSLPNYHMTSDLGKEELLKICLNDPNLKKYIPDSGYLEEIKRDFLLMVIYRLNKF